MGDQQEFTAASTAKKNSVVVKVGMVGDSQIGKTSLMVKYVEGTFDEDYIQTLGMGYYQHYKHNAKFWDFRLSHVPVVSFFPECVCTCVLTNDRR